MEIKARDLIAAGWHEGRRLGVALRRAREMEAAGMERAAMLAQLEREFPRQLPVILPWHEPAPLAEAIVADSAEEADNLATARARMRELLHVPVIDRGVLMPDACPAGPGRATIPVGGAIEVAHAIMPGAHSADICCSMFATFFPANNPVGELMDQLHKTTHFGAGGRPRGNQWDSPVLEEPVWDNPFLKDLRSRARDFLGTQGDGNHFAYIGHVTFNESQRAALERAGYTDLTDWIERRDGVFNVLVTHHGSRGLGADVYRRGQAVAERWCRENARDIPRAAVWLPVDSPEGAAYWDALQYVSRWTRENHAQIHAAFLRRIGQRALVQVGNEHNFVWRRGEAFYHGKGSTPAWTAPDGRPLLGLIPLNMAREILVVLGGNNDAFLSFCPHGAGRNRSRSATMREFKDGDGELDAGRVRDAITRETRGLDIRWYCGAPDLSESPLGYKDAGKVKAQIAQFGLATVVGEIQPRGCIMAGEQAEPHWARARREKRAKHKASRRDAAREIGDSDFDG